MEPPYERLLSDAMIGDGALFTREDAVEAAWAAVDPVLTRHRHALPYRRGTWGPPAADGLIKASGRLAQPDAAPDRRVTALPDVVFLLDCDNTLLDNDRIEQDLREHLAREFGAVNRDRYWAIFEQLRGELGLRRLPRSAAALPAGRHQRYPAAPDVVVPGRLPVREPAVSAVRSTSSSDCTGAA